MTNPKPMKATKRGTKRERELVAALKKYGQHVLCTYFGLWQKGDAKRCTCGLAAAISGGGR